MKRIRTTHKKERREGEREREREMLEDEGKKYKGFLDKYICKDKEETRWGKDYM